MILIGINSIWPRGGPALFGDPHCSNPSDFDEPDEDDAQVAFERQIAKDQEEAASTAHHRDGRERPNLVPASYAWVVEHQRAGTGLGIGPV